MAVKPSRLLVACYLLCAGECCCCGVVVLSLSEACFISTKENEAASLAHAVTYREMKCPITKLSSCCTRCSQAVQVVPGSCRRLPSAVIAEYTGGSCVSQMICTKTAH